MLMRALVELRTGARACLYLPRPCHTAMTSVIRSWRNRNTHVPVQYIQKLATMRALLDAGRGYYVWQLD